MEVTTDHIVLAIRLFGSAARGDSDDDSDLDVLLVVRDDAAPREVGRERDVNRSIPPGADVSVYSGSRIKELFAAGSLFAWHLYRESSSLLDLDAPDFVDDVGAPASYSNAVEDIRVLLDDLRELPGHIRTCPANVVFEAGNAYVCLRNIAISLSWFLPSGPVFGRSAPFCLGPLMQREFPISPEEYQVLMRCRRAGSRASAAPRPNLSEVLDTIGRGLTWAGDAYHKALELR